ncbi:MAG: biliverdin-producing heme oxygenase [Planctomycetota bacterium]
MNLPEHLRNATREIHEQLHLVVDLTRLLSDRVEYGAGLLRYQAAVQPVEEWLTKTKTKLPAAELPGDLQDRLCKVAWLEEDRRALSQLVDSRPQRSSSRPVFDLNESKSHLISQVAGVLYVMEGMTLGGMQISKQLSDQLQVDIDSGGRFFAGYAQETGSRWTRLKEWLVNVGSRPDHNDDVASDAAKRVFDHFATSLRSHQVSLDNGTRR